jgi:preprotein translocase subunit SecD
MRFLCLLLGFLLVTYSPARAGHSPPKVTFRIHVQTTGEGLSPQQASIVLIPPRGEQIQVRTLPEITEQDIVDVEPLASGGIHVVFDHVGTVALNAVTAQNQGRLLVVLIDGTVVYAPIIDVQIDNGQLDIPHALNLQIVQLLQDLARKNVIQAART